MQLHNIVKYDTLSQDMTAAAPRDFSGMLSNVGSQIIYRVWDSAQGKYTAPLYVLRGLVEYDEQTEQNGVRVESAGTLTLATADVRAQGIVPKESDLVIFGAREYTVQKPYYYAINNADADFSESVIIRMRITEKGSLLRSAPMR